MGIDEKRIAIWTCSANTRTGMRIAFKSRPDNIIALVVYYGTPDSLGQLRQNLPMLLVRPGMDNQFSNMGMEQFIQNALTQDIRLEVINYLNGVHAFDLFTNTDESRNVIRKTVSFLKENLFGPAIPNEFILTNRNFMWLMQNNMTTTALDEFRKARTRLRADSNFNPFFNGLLREVALNANAYWLLQHQRQPQALETFKLMVETFPASPNAYDGLADAYEALGNRTEAVKASEKTLHLLPAAELPGPFKASVRSAAEDKIRRLKQ